jgi:hypothetical protein
MMIRDFGRFLSHPAGKLLIRLVVTLELVVIGWQLFDARRESVWVALYLLGVVGFAVWLNLAFYRRDRAYETLKSSLDLLRALRGAEAPQAIAQLRALGVLAGEKSMLRGADLRHARFHNAEITNANFVGADLRYASFAGANLRDANLQGADVWDVDFCGANLWGADLRGVRHIANARFDAETRLPDGSQWTPETDMQPFVT